MGLYARFKYTPDVIDFTYDNLVQAINDAIDKQMAEEGDKFFTEERNNLYASTGPELDFDELVDTFNNLIQHLIDTESEEKFDSYWQPRIVQITDRYLGKGQKVNNCSRDQTEALDLIVTDLQDLINQNK